MHVITSQNELFTVIEHIHRDCHQLCHAAIGQYVPVAGNMGVFCHEESEFEFLTMIRKELTEPSDTPGQKYFLLKEPIVFETKDGIPKAEYTHLYIRKPDPTPYGSHSGDVDFLLNPAEYARIKCMIGPRY